MLAKAAGDDLSRAPDAHVSTPIVRHRRAANSGAPCRRRRRRERCGYFELEIIAVIVFAPSPSASAHGQAKHARWPSLAAPRQVIMRNTVENIACSPSGGKGGSALPLPLQTHYRTQCLYCGGRLMRPAFRHAGSLGGEPRSRAAQDCRRRPHPGMFRQSAKWAGPTGPSSITPPQRVPGPHPVGFAVQPGRQRASKASSRQGRWRPPSRHR